MLVYTGNSTKVALDEELKRFQNYPDYDPLFANKKSPHLRNKISPFNDGIRLGYVFLFGEGSGSSGVILTNERMHRKWPRRLCLSF